MEIKVRKIFEKAQALLEQKGAQSLEEAQRRISAIKVESREVREALAYFASYWHDLARPALLSLACEAVGGSPAIDFGTATVLMGGAISIYDDIIDRSKVKRSRPTVLGKFGNDIALLTATALLFESFTHLCGLLKKLETSKVNAILKLFGEYGASQANLILIEYNQQKSSAILRCSHTTVEMVRASIASVTEINGKPVVIHVVGVSGTLRALRRKHGCE